MLRLTTTAAKHSAHTRTIVALWRLARRKRIKDTVPIGVKFLSRAGFAAKTVPPVHAAGSATTVPWAKIAGFVSEVDMQDINPIRNSIGDLKGRVTSLRGYL